MNQPENILCRHCKQRGLRVLATDCDHVVPFRGVDDLLRLDVNNLAPLCEDCHASQAP